MEDIFTDQRQNVKKQEEENEWQLNAISPVAAAVLSKVARAATCQNYHPRRSNLLISNLILKSEQRKQEWFGFLRRRTKVCLHLSTETPKNRSLKQSRFLAELLRRTNLDF